MTTTGPDNLYLSPDQQDLLLAALTSNSASSPMFNTPGLSHVSGQEPRGRSYMNTPAKQSPPLSASLSSGFPQGTPLLGGDMEYTDWDLDADGNWDYDLSGEQLQDSPESMNDEPNDVLNVSGGVRKQTKAEGNDKRKQPPEGDVSVDPHDAEPKRRDSDEKTPPAKKPGRKPLTSEPTSKRKAQNRAAQRAFRDRKEKHLKDLEQKVEDLQKASESANHENSLLRAQVDRLQTELREYKRRLQSSERTKQAPIGFGALSGFQFDFPPFGTNNFPKTNIVKLNGVGTKTADQVKRSPPTNGTRPTNNSSSKFASPPSTTTAIPSNLSDLFSPSIIDEVNGTPATDYMSAFDSSRTPSITGGRGSTSSPSASSVSQHGPGSSCGTSPEPMNNSPISSKPSNSLLNSISEENISIKPTENGDQYVCKSGPVDGETESTFCEKLGMACGNPYNPIPKAPQFSSGVNGNSLDWLSQQASTSTFDPVFNDYRDPVNNINTNLGMSFFDDAIQSIPNFTDMGSPPASGDAAAPVSVQTKNADPIAQCDAINGDDDDEVVPADDPSQMLSCNKIWSVTPECRDRISSHPRFVSGELDMDGLCSELRSKAKCSEVGVVVAEQDVREVLGKVGMPSKDLKM